MLKMVAINVLEVVGQEYHAIEENVVQVRKNGHLCLVHNFTVDIDGFLKIISILISYIFFKANVKTGIADASRINGRVTALVVMLHGCLQTARNHAIGVQIQMVSSIHLLVIKCDPLKKFGYL